MSNIALTATISSVTEHNGETLVELPIGSKDGVSSGSFFRIYSPDEQQLIKGTIKIEEVVDASHSLARLVGEVLDRNNPLKVNDKAREIRDLGLLVSASNVEVEAREKWEDAKQEDEKQADEFQKLRANFQKELKQLQEQHEQNVVLLTERHERATTRMSEDHDLALKRKDLERRADLAAMQSSIKRESHTLLKSEKDKTDSKVKGLEKERNKLDDQIQSMLKQQTSLQERITSLVEELAISDTSHQKSIRAEVESREVLEARIRQLEHELAGDAMAEEIILTNDANRNETILERLSRISGERESAIKSNNLLRSQIAELDRKMTKQDETVKNLREDISILEGSNKNQRLSLENLKKLESDLSRTKESLSATSLARLETERALYDLAIRVIRLQNDDESLDHLKQRIRKQYLPESEQ